MKNIYDIAYELESSLREQPAFQALTESYAAVQADEESLSKIVLSFNNALI